MIQGIIDAFTGLDLYGWLSQISGLIAFVLLGIGYLFPKKKFLFFTTVAHFFFTLESAFVLLYPSTIVSFIALIRNFAALMYSMKKNKPLNKVWIYSLSASIVISNIIFIAISKSWLDFTTYLPMIACLLVTFTQNSKNEFVVKGGGLFNEVIFLVYFAVAALPFSVLRQAILVVSGIVGIILLVVKKNKASK